MCDDLDPDDPPEGEPYEDDPERDAFFAQLRRELFGDTSPQEPRAEGAPPTAGERVLYALGQLHRLHAARRLPVHPSALCIEDVARIVGVAGELEFTTEGRHGQHFHLAGEVLDVRPAAAFPWRLLSVWEWAAEQEANSRWPDGGD